MSWAIWITGPTGSGKTTLARAVAAALRSRGSPVEVLDLDEIERILLPAPASDAEREVVYRALAYMAMLLTRTGASVLIDATAPRHAWPELARTLIPAFAEVRLVCPVEVCLERGAARPIAHVPLGIDAWSGQPGPTAPEGDTPHGEARDPELLVDTRPSHLGDFDTAVQEVLYIARRLQRRASWLESRQRVRPAYG